MRRCYRSIHTDVKVAFLVFLTAAIGGWSYLTAYDITTGGPEYSAREAASLALALATGHGFSAFTAEPPAVDDFLSKKVMRLDPRAIPPGTEFVSAWNIKFCVDRYCLAHAVAIVWRIFGISWRAVNIFLAFVFAVIAATIYGIFRLGMGRIISLAGMALTMLSPVMLTQIPFLRDFCKAPFILATIFFCGYLLSREVRRGQFLAIAAVMGFVIGIGVGFRQDSIICLPPALLFVAFFVRGKPRISVPARLAGVLLLLAAFLPPALPVLRMTSDTGGNNSFYLTQGFSSPCLCDLDLVPSSYVPLSTGSDYIVHAYIYTFARSHLDYLENMQSLQTMTALSGIAEAQATPLTPTLFWGAVLAGKMKMGVWSKPAEMAARQYVYELATTFPADVIARWYAATLRAIRNLQPVSALIHPNSTTLRLQDMEAPLAGHLYHYGLFYAVAAFVVLSGYSFWLAAGTLFILLYFFGYPSLEFHVRHAFHLNFASFWFPGFILGMLMSVIRRCRVIALVKPPYQWPSLLSAFRLLEPLCPRALIRPLFRMALFVLFSMASLCLPLYVARAYQDRTVTQLHNRYLKADLEPLPMVPQTDSQGKAVYSPARLPAFERVPPVELCDVLAMAGLPVRRVPDVLAEYLVAEFETTGADPSVQIMYQDPAASFDIFMPYRLSREPNPCTFRFFFPVFYFTDNFERPYYATVSAFRGLSFVNSVNFKGFYRVRNAQDFPFLMNVWLPSDPALFRKCYRVKLLTE